MSEDSLPLKEPCLPDTVAATVTQDKYVLILYVTGTTPRSMLAINNLHRICEKHLPGAYDLQVIDIYQSPELASQAQIIAAPTLIKMLPEPVQRAVGDLSDEHQVMIALNLQVASHHGN